MLCDILVNPEEYPEPDVISKTLQYCAQTFGVSKQDLRPALRKQMEEFENQRFGGGKTVVQRKRKEAVEDRDKAVRKRTKGNKAEAKKRKHT